MALLDKQKEIFDHWNSKKITVHKALSQDMKTQIARALQSYQVEDVKGFIDFYATILEIGVPEDKKKYFWSYKWNLYEFLMRGVKKFDGQTLENYQRRQRFESPEAIVFKRK